MTNQGENFRKRFYFITTLFMFCILIFSMFQGGCRSEKISDKISASLKNAKTGDSIQLKNWTNFTWDSVYIFSPTLGKKYIEKTICGRINEYQEFSCFICFKHQNKIIYSEFFNSGIENPENNEIDFDSLYHFGTHRAYSLEEAKFKVMLSNYGADIKYYTLLSGKPIIWEYR